MPATNAAIPKPASFVLLTLIPEAAAARSFERTASIRCPRLERTLATRRARRIVADEDEDAEHGARQVVVDAAEGRVRAEVEAPELGLRDRRARRPAAPASVEEAELLEREGGRQRDDHQADAAHSERGDGDQQPDNGRRGGADQQRDGELGPDASEVGRQMRHREARDAGERELHHGDLPDEADDDHEREADDDAEERVDQRLAEVVREHDQADDAGEQGDPAPPAEPLRARHGWRRLSTISPRPGRLAPRRKSATTMTGRRTARAAPQRCAPSSVGNQVCVDQYWSSDWNTPIARPAKHATKNDVNPARSAAARAGTTWNAIVRESSVTRAPRARRARRRRRSRARCSRARGGRATGPRASRRPRSPRPLASRDRTASSGTVPPAPRRRRSRSRRA